MLRHALLLTMLLVPAAALPQDVPSDHERMQGHWKLVRHEIGRPGFDPALNGSANRMMMKVVGDEMESTSTTTAKVYSKKFSLNEKTTPKQITFFSQPFAGKPGVKITHGIYEIVGDRLRICYTLKPQAEFRPKDFTVPQTSERVLMEFEGAKK